MENNGYEALGPLLTQFGQIVIDQIGQISERAYLFVYCENNWAQVALFVDEDDIVRWYRPDEKLFEIATEIWSIDNAQRAKKLRWTYFEYDIQDSKFNTHFVYPEEIPETTGPLEWQEVGLEKRFGAKHVIYPDKLPER